VRPCFSVLSSLRWSEGRRRDEYTTRHLFSVPVPPFVKSVPWTSDSKSHVDWTCARCNGMSHIVLLKSSGAKFPSLPFLCLRTQRHLHHIASSYFHEWDSRFITSHPPFVRTGLSYSRTEPSRPNTLGIVGTKLFRPKAQHVVVQQQLY
jgi:hypothetical protein